MSDPPTWEDFERYRAGHTNRVYAIPIIEDDYDARIQFGDPPAAILYAPDRIVGYRFYVERDGDKLIMEVRGRSDFGSLFKLYYRDWDEDDALRKHVDAHDYLDGDDFHGSFARRKEQELLDKMRSPDA